MIPKNLNKTERLIELTSLSLLALLLISTIVAYIPMPDDIPVILDDNGSVTAYDNKIIIFQFPVIGTIVHVALTIIIRYLVMHRDETKTDITGQPEHTLTVRIMRLAKVLVNTGLLVSVLETVKLVYPSDKTLVTTMFVAELIIVAAVFSFVIKQTLDFLRKK